MVRKPGRWHGAAFAAPLLTAAVLRGLLPLAGVEGDTRWWLMALAGSIAVGAVGVFGWLFLRAHQTHRGYLQRIAARREQTLPMAE
ncbi:MAG: hypothetical protein GEU80_04920 [Dehalococcoidia bacterium]|nr:hypothetical protein [Dehalococcoidia bacterium]